MVVVLNTNNSLPGVKNVSDTAPFKWKLRVYYEDTDLGGVVYYANYLKFMERARTEWLRAMGLENRGLLEQQAAVFVVTACQIKYRQAARMDDELIITVEQLQCKKVTATVVQNIYKGDQLLAQSLVEFAYIDASSMKPKRLPEVIVNYG